MASCKSKLILCDTCVIIEAFRLGIWDALINSYTIIVSQTVVEETMWYLSDSGNRIPIDLNSYASNGKIQVIDPESRDLESFLSRHKFNEYYSQRMDPGELSLLCFLDKTQDDIICSGDEIVFRVLGKLCCSDKGISLEELLKNIGLTKKISIQFTKKFRISCSSKGFDDSFV
jgi:hypothetical protein